MKVIFKNTLFRFFVLCVVAILLAGCYDIEDDSFCDDEVHFKNDIEGIWLVDGMIECPITADKLNYPRSMQYASTVNVDGIAFNSGQCLKIYNDGTFCDIRHIVPLYQSVDKYSVKLGSLSISGCRITVDFISKEEYTKEALKKLGVTTVRDLDVVEVEDKDFYSVQNYLIEYIDKDKNGFWVRDSRYYLLHYKKQSDCSLSSLPSFKR